MLPDKFLDKFPGGLAGGVNPYWSPDPQIFLDTLFPDGLFTDCPLPDVFGV